MSSAALSNTSTTGISRNFDMMKKKNKMLLPQCNLKFKKSLLQININCHTIVNLCIFLQQECPEILM